MSAMLPVVTETAIPITLQAALETAAELASNEKAPATRKAYASDFRIFERWCAQQGLAALPADPAAVAGFIADEASRGVKASTSGAVSLQSSIATRRRARPPRPMTNGSRLSCAAPAARLALRLASLPPRPQRRPSGCLH